MKQLNKNVLFFGGDSLEISKIPSRKRKEKENKKRNKEVIVNKLFYAGLYVPYFFEHIKLCLVRTNKFVFAH